MPEVLFSTRPSFRLRRAGCREEEEEVMVGDEEKSRSAREWRRRAQTPAPAAPSEPTTLTLSTTTSHPAHTLLRDLRGIPRNRPRIYLVKGNHVQQRSILHSHPLVHPPPFNDPQLGCNSPNQYS